MPKELASGKPTTRRYWSSSRRSVSFVGPTRCLRTEMGSTRSKWPAGQGDSTTPSYAATATHGQFTSIRYGERLVEIGATPLIGTVGDSYDALAETANGYYKAELVRGPACAGRWKKVEDLDLATLGWVR